MRFVRSETDSARDETLEDLSDLGASRRQVGLTSVAATLVSARSFRDRPEKGRSLA
jgi:hypothetical protein